MRDTTARAWLLIGAFVLAVPTAASAESPSVVVVLPPDASSAARELEVRIRGELSTLGYTVVTSTVGKAGARAGSDAIVVAIRDDADGPSVELQVTMGGAQLRRAEEGSALAPLAVRVAEAVHARAVPPEQDVPPEPEDLEPQRERDDQQAGRIRRPTETGVRPEESGWRWALHAGPAATLGSLQRGIGWGPSLGFSVRSPLGLEGRLSLIGPDRGRDIELSDGSASIQLTVGALEVGVRPWPDAVLSPSVHLLSGAAWLHTSGSAEPPLSPRDDDVWAFLVGGGVGLHVALSRRFGIRLDLRVAASLPALGVRIGAQRTEAIGRPIGWGTLTAEVSF